MAIPQTNFNPPFNITRASHLVFTAQDLAASRAFYTEVIGLIVSDEDADTLWLRGVEERGHHSLTLKKTTGEPSCECIGMHVFDEEDLDKAKSHFDRTGIAAKFVEVPYQGRTLRFTDLMGTPVELVATMQTAAAHPCGGPYPQGRARLAHGPLSGAGAGRDRGPRASTPTWASGSPTTSLSRAPTS